MSTPGSNRIDWQSERDRVDLVRVATDLLGPAPGRKNASRGQHWWLCPFHADANPSLLVDPVRASWKCYACNEHGDAATLVMKLEGLTFPQAITKLLGGQLGPTTHRPPPRRPAIKEPEPPRGLPLALAFALVEASEARLSSDEGADAREYLTRERHLTAETIRSARLGWTPRAEIPSKEGKLFVVSGIVIPWSDGDRLALVKIRRPDGAEPRYAEAFRDRPSVYPSPDVAAVGLPLVIVEGEFDAMLLGQELAGLATVATLGSASQRPDASALAALTTAEAWYVATDQDDAGEVAASTWAGPRTRRARPPGSFKDWTEAAQGGVNLRRWWTDRLAGVETPELFTWAELATWRWAGADDSPGIVIPAPPPTDGPGDPGKEAA